MKNGGINLVYLNHAAFSYDEIRHLKEEEHKKAFCEIFTAFFQSLVGLDGDLLLKTNELVCFTLASRSYSECSIIKRAYYALIPHESFFNNLEQTALDLYLSEVFVCELSCGGFLFTISCDPVYFEIKRQK